MAISKSILGVAGEFAVAAELCRRNLYAQLTLGHQKRTDLLVLSATGCFCRIEVKAKQGREWPGCRGISASDSFLVFVDFSGKNDDERPDFYILTVPEWREVVLAEETRLKAKYPDRAKYLRTTEENVLVWSDQLTKSGSPYTGVGVRPDNIREHLEAWHKFSHLIGE